MSMATSFLGGAKDRLLPASIPFRFFLSAAGFQVAAWAVLVFAAGEVGAYAGGPGLVLAALHLATLGVFAMTAMGAAYQLLPVVTRQPLGRVWPARLSFWLMLPGIIGLTWGMGTGQGTFMQAGGILTSAGLALFTGLTAHNLSRAGAIAVIAGHGWAALVALVALAGLGLTLIWDFSGGFLEDRAQLASLHMGLALFGFMGLLVAGFSMVLIPMFVLSRSLPTRPGWAGLALAATGLIAFSAARLTGNALLDWLALAAGATAAGVHVWLMRLAETRSMRRRLGLPFVLIRAGRYLLLGALLLVALVWAGTPVANAPSLIGFTFVAGWLLTFLTGVMQRILPFLASMHASGASGMPLLMSDLTAETPLRLHMGAHFAALAAVGLGIALDATPLIRLGAVLGLIGALAFLIFAGNVVWQLNKAARTKGEIKRGKPVPRRRP